ncbi:MAG: UDP-3-O-[3-hydroxymyristoyl] N-acetylglucosamine deacetylase [Candidatus Omnitrophica bacterium]|nr:UDP-3-O-[3-hydroxymyristoyl] N-acetylglucosamine deacetylase [Candidatus Omnitrophota bacterium]
MFHTNQHTISGDAVFSGRALQSGHRVKVVCKGAGENTGIVFSRSDLPGKPSFRVSNAFILSGPYRRSVVGFEKAVVHTVEHLLAALWALEIDNIMIEVNGIEIPGMDGSAIEFYKGLKTAGVAAQSAKRCIVHITEPITVENKEASISIVPSGSFGISYHIDYDIASIPKEDFTVEFSSGTFEKEIGPARTFCLKKEAMLLRLLGLGKGATYENTLVMGKTGPVKNTLRYPNEPVRHKVLDILGDFYLLGRPVVGKIIAKKSGHRLNAELVKKIYERYLA